METKVNDKIGAATYVVYMMMGSYFKKALCDSTLRLGQLRIAYCEQKSDNQIKIEERCVNYIESRVIGVVPEIIFQDMVNVKFVRKDDMTVVRFIGLDWYLDMWAYQNKGSINFDYKFMSNEDEL
jgi:hypothetical protein